MSPFSFWPSSANFKALLWALVATRVPVGAKKNEERYDEVIFFSFKRLFRKEFLYEDFLIRTCLFSTTRSSRVLQVFFLAAQVL